MATSDATATTRYDPFDPAVLENPYPAYRWLRDEAPVYHVAEHDIWTLARYEDVVGAVRNHRVFSSNEGVSYERRPTPMLIAMDPPDHTRLRRLVARQFTPTAIAALRGRIESLVDTLLDRALEAGEVDFVKAVAEPVPVQVIVEMLGVPAERAGDFRRWSDATIETTGGVLSPENEAQILEFATYCSDLAAERRPRAHEGEDLVSLLLRPDKDGELLTDAEIVAFLVLLLVAGHETTMNLLSNAAQALMERPEEWAKVVADPGLVPSLVEESLRWVSPVQGLYRNTLTEVEVAGTTIPAGAKVLMLYGSANRDDRRFPDAEAFVADRNPTDHVGFGSGIHLCLGAPLARLEADVVARAFLRRVRSMTPAGPVVRGHNPSIRSITSLPVRIRAA